MVMGRPRSFCMDKALDEAMEVFWRHGYDGASLAMLTKAMGIKPPSLYAAFGSKEGLLKAALDRYAERRSEHMHYVLAGEKWHVTSANHADHFITVFQRDATHAVSRAAHHAYIGLVEPDAHPLLGREQDLVAGLQVGGLPREADRDHEPSRMGQYAGGYQFTGDARGTGAGSGNEERIADLVLLRKLGDIFLTIEELLMSYNGILVLEVLMLVLLVRWRLRRHTLLVSCEHFPS